MFSIPICWLPARHITWGQADLPSVPPFPPLPIETEVQSGQPAAWPGAGGQEQRAVGRRSRQQAGEGSPLRPSVTRYCPGPAPPSRGLSLK